MEYGGMIPVADQIADFGCGQIRISLSQVHGHLTGLHYITLARLGMNSGRFQAIVRAYRPDDVIHGDRLVLIMRHFLHDTLGQFQVDIPVIDGCVGHNGDDDALQIADTVAHILSNVIHHFRRELKPVATDFVTQDVAAQFHSRFLQFSHHTPFETGDKPLFHPLKQHWRTV